MLVIAILVGGLAGWLIGSTGRAALATAVAGFIFPLGHNNPAYRRYADVGKELVIMMAIIVISALVLVKGHA